MNGGCTVVVGPYIDQFSLVLQLEKKMEMEMQIFVCNSSDFIRRYERQKEVEVKEDKGREREKQIMRKRHKGQWAIGDNGQSGML